MSRDPRFDGRFFVAVKTTGIFCRPICPARLPQEKNVDYYTTAAQAVNKGFRPCLRCRPDSAPLSPAWKGSKATLARAQKLLSEIPVQSVARVAERLGIGERYLHSLVTKHIGCSPKQYQDIQRVLFAKQLLQQSRLPVGDIAFIAGYESMRQFQRAVKQYLKVTPSDMRKNTTRSTELKTDIHVSIHFRPPYDWDKVREFLALRAMHGVEDVTLNSYARYFIHEGVKGYLKATINPDKNRFDVVIRVDDLKIIHAVITALKGMLDTDADPMMIRHSLIASGYPVADICEGLRLPTTWNVFESGCRAILGQQVSVKAAVGQLNKVIEALGEQYQSGVYFPSPEAIAASDLSFLRMPSRRKEALKTFAELFVNGATPSHDDILDIKGIGGWTLDYLKMRGERNPDVYLAGDLIVKKMAQAYNLVPDAAAPWRSYLTLQLWERYNIQVQQ